MPSVRTAVSTPASRAQLRRAAVALVAAVQEHTAAVLSLPPGPSCEHRLAELNQQVYRAVAAWDIAVYTDTGSYPLAIDVDDGDLD